MSVPLLSQKKVRALDHFKGGRLKKARDLLEEVVKQQPADMEAWVCLAQIHAQLGQASEVEHCCRQVIALWPGSIDAHYYLAYALLLQAKHDEAVEGFRQVLTLNPNHLLAQVHLGKTLHILDRYDEALACYQKALTLAPGIPEVHAMIGCIQQRRGQLEAAIASYQRDLGLRPRDYGLHSDLISTFNYSDAYDAASVYAEHVRWGRSYKLQIPGERNYANIRKPDRKLRVGYVSPDLRRHSVASFIEPLLANHSSELVETFCYAQVGSPDSVTDRLRAMSCHWLNTCGMSDAALAERIRNDRIDILVDLVGHNSGHRLVAFTAKPAPIQITYLGYPNTTGIAEMDYRFTDVWADPPGSSEIYHTETLIRLPRGFLCYRGLEDAPQVTALPAASRGTVTFGSFNNYMKVTPQVIATWAELLKQMPTARLLMKTPSFGDSGTRKLCLELFRKQGIADGQLELLGPLATQAEHMAVYGQVDIALDTFPYNGTTTTCEAMWMGIPVITLGGSRHAGRVGVSLLSQVGLEDLIATSLDDYVQRATALANDIDALAMLRVSLRHRMLTSPLCDEIGFTASIEQAYRQVWKKWCGDST